MLFTQPLEGLGPPFPIPQGMGKSDGIMKCIPWRLAIVHTLVHNMFVMCCDSVLFLCLLPGVDPVQSGRDFKAFIFMELCTRTPLNIEENGVLLTIDNSQEVYVHDCLQRLRTDKLRRALIVLREMFAQRTPPPGSCTAWSVAVEDAGLVDLHVAWGLRQGRVGGSIERYSQGIFRPE